MRLSRKVFVILCVLSSSALFLLPPAGAKGIQFQHLASVYSDDKNFGLKQPEGVAYGRDAGVIVADTGNGRLLRYLFEENKLKSIKGVIKMPQLTYPVKAEISSTGDIYVLDGRQRRVLRLSPAGEFKGYVEPRGLPGSGAVALRSFEIDASGNVYLLDILSERVLVLNPAGEYIRHVAFPQTYGFFSDLTVDGEGRVLLVDSVRATVFAASKNDAALLPLTGPLKEYVRFPANLTTDSRGRIYLVDRNGGSVAILGRDGTFLSRQSAMGWKEGFLNYPSQICINDRGEVFIADTRNNRIQMFKTVE